MPPYGLTQQRGRVLSLIGGLNRLTRAVGPAIGGWISVLGCVLLSICLSGSGHVSNHASSVAIIANDDSRIPCRVNVPFYARCGAAAVGMAMVFLAWPSHGVYDACMHVWTYGCMDVSIYVCMHVLHFCTNHKRMRVHTYLHVDITLMHAYWHAVPAAEEEDLQTQEECGVEHVVHQRPVRAAPEHGKHSIKGMASVVAQYWHTILPAGTFVFALSLVRGAR